MTLVHLYTAIVSLWYRLRSAHEIARIHSEGDIVIASYKVSDRKEASYRSLAHSQAIQDARTQYYRDSRIKYYGATSKWLEDNTRRVVVTPKHDIEEVESRTKSIAKVKPTARTGYCYHCGDRLTSARAKFFCPEKNGTKRWCYSRYYPKHGKASQS